MSGAKEKSKGRWSGILEEVGKIDRKFLDGRHHKCPVTGDGNNRFRFSNKNGMGNYFCHCSEGNKDGFDLLRCKFSWDFATAAREVETYLKVDRPMKEDKQQQPKSPEKIKRDLGEIVKSKRADPKHVRRYLEGRGIKVWPQNVFQAYTYYGLFPIGVTRPMDAMATVLMNKDGKNETIHLTYLFEGKKAELSRQRVVATPVKQLAGCAARLAPVGPDGLLGLGEGIESSLSAMQLYGAPTWATISANGMATFELPTDVEIKRLVIYPDCDSNFVGQAAAFHLARRICARKDHPEVQIVMPLEGQAIVGCDVDYNEIVQSMMEKTDGS